MCLAVPLKIVSKEGSFATVAAGRLQRRINIAMVPGVAVGEYVLVHAGFAIEKIDPRRAAETLRVLREIC